MLVRFLKLYCIVIAIVAFCIVYQRVQSLYSLVRTLSFLSSFQNLHLGLSVSPWQRDRVASRAENRATTDDIPYDIN